MEPRPAGAHSSRTATRRLLPRILPASNILSFGTVFKLFGKVRGERGGGEGGGRSLEESESGQESERVCLSCVRNRFGATARLCLSMITQGRSGMRRSQL